MPPQGIISSFTKQLNVFLQFWEIRTDMTFNSNLFRRHRKELYIKYKFPILKAPHDSVLLLHRNLSSVFFQFCHFLLKIASSMIPILTSLILLPVQIIAETFFTEIILLSMRQENLASRKSTLRKPQFNQGRCWSHQFVQLEKINHIYQKEDQGNRFFKTVRIVLLLSIFTFVNWLKFEHFFDLVLSSALVAMQP